MFIFPAQLTTSRIGNLTRLIHTLAICDGQTYLQDEGFRTVKPSGNHACTSLTVAQQKQTSVAVLAPLAAQSTPTTIKKKKNCVQKKQVERRWQLRRENREATGHPEIKTLPRNPSSILSPPEHKPLRTSTQCRRAAAPRRSQYP